MAKRTREDLIRALTWRHSSGCRIIGAARYHWYGFVGRYLKVVFGNTCDVMLFKTADEVESAVASMIAAQPTARRLL